MSDPIDRAEVERLLRHAERIRAGLATSSQIGVFKVNSTQSVLNLGRPLLAAWEERDAKQGRVLWLEEAYEKSKEENAALRTALSRQNQISAENLRLKDSCKIFEEMALGFREDNVRLRAALEPFVKIARERLGPHIGDSRLVEAEAGYFRTAREALEQQGGGND